MKFSNNYNAFLDDILTVETVKDLKDLETVKKKINTKTNSIVKNRLANFYAYIVIALFVISYGVLIVFLKTIFDVEVELIKQNLLDAEDRSINSLAVSAIIAGTITQTGVCFYLITKNIFEGKSNNFNL